MCRICITMFTLLSPIILLIYSICTLVKDICQEYLVFDHVYSRKEFGPERG